MAQHRHRQRGIVGLVRASQRGPGQVEFAVAVAVRDAFAHFGEPIEIADRGSGADQHCLFDDRADHVGAIGLSYQRHAGAGDPGFLERDAAQRILRHAFFGHQQEAFVVDPQVGDPAGGLAIEHIGRIEPAA